MALSQSTHPAPPLRVLDLPAELREQIWALALWPQSKQITTSKTNFEEIGRGYKPPSLLAVNRQIRREASKIFYSGTLFWKSWSYFSYSATKLLCRWFISLSEMDQENIKTIRLEHFAFEYSSPLRIPKAIVTAARIRRDIEDVFGRMNIEKQTAETVGDRLGDVLECPAPEVSGGFFPVGENKIRALREAHRLRRGALLPSKD